MIGPSGVGKTNCGQAAAAQLHVEFRSLDVLCRGRTNDWACCLTQFDKAELESASPSALLIMDIGAGTQYDCTQQLCGYLEPRRSRVVLIYAPPNEAIARNPLGPSRDPGQYLQMEYKSRALLYRVAGHTVDVSGKSAHAAAEVFVNYLSDVLRVPRR